MIVISEQKWKIGDCLELMRELPDKHFDLILTDPPYGIGEADGRNLTRGGCADPTDYGKSDWDNKRITKEHFKEMFRISKNQIIFGGNYYIDYLKPTPCMIVWDKDNSGDFADCELARTSFNTAVRLFKYRWNGMLQGDMKNKEERVHPTQKPVPLFKWILKKYAKVGDKICDPFLGSGTTLEACMNLDLDCIGFELSNEWEDHYRKRLKLDNTKLTDNW